MRAVYVLNAEPVSSTYDVIHGLSLACGHEVLALRSDADVWPCKICPPEEDEERLS